MNPKESLLNLLAFLKAIYFLHWSNHWRVEGNPSYGDHLLFERLYGLLPSEIDGLAEKIIAMFGSDAISMSQLAATELSVHQQLEQEPDLHKRAEWAEKELQRLVKDIFDNLEVEEALPLGLNDYLAALANSHDTHVYLLQQRLRPEGRVAGRHLLKK